MPSHFPRSPKLMKGALVVYEAQTPGPPPKIIVFQYNPEQLQRKLENRAAKAKPGANAKEDVLRVEGPPKETISVTVVLNAADQLAEPQQNKAVTDWGLLPALSTLEMLLYPSTFRVLENDALSQAGAVKVKPAELPLTLLVWGKSRAVPVQIDSFSITEEAFDQALNPIQAKVELGLKVLTYLELPKTSQGRDVYFSYQRQKETLAQQHQSDSEDSRTVSGFLPSGS
jgi:hypothetical protein